MDFQPPSPPPVETPDVPVDLHDGSWVTTGDGPQVSGEAEGSVQFDDSPDPSIAREDEQQDAEPFSPAEDPSVEQGEADHGAAPFSPAEDPSVEQGEADHGAEAFSPAERSSVESEDVGTDDVAPEIPEPVPAVEATSDANDREDEDGDVPEPAAVSDGGDLVELSHESDDDETDDGRDDGGDADARQQFLDVLNRAFAPFGVHLTGPKPMRTGAVVLDHGDTNAKQRLAPDGTNSFTSPDGSTVTVQSDGSVVVSVGVRLRTTPEGDLEAITPDGYTANASRRGDLWVEAPNGSVRGLGRDGTVSISDGTGWSVVSTPDGTSSTETVTSPDGASVSSSTDGTRSITRPDGSSTTVRPDGTVVNALPDGSVVVKDPGGEVSATTPDGVTTVTKPNGDVEVYDTDGFVSYPLDDEPGLVPVDTPDIAMIKGAADSVRETAQFFWGFSPIRGLIDPDGYARDVDNLVAGVRYAVMNPVETVQRIVEDTVEAFATDPFRAVGKLLTDLGLGGPIGKADDVADVGKAGAKLADAADSARAVDEVEDAGDVARASSLVDSADGGRSFVPSARSDGLALDESEELARVRTEVFNLPIRPTESKTAIVGVLVLESGERLPIHSGKFGGPWGGTHRGGIPRGDGSGFTAHTLTHVEGHAAAIMHQRGIQKATLLIEKMPCGACDNPTQRPNITAMLPANAELTVVDRDAAGIYRSVQR